MSGTLIGDIGGTRSRLALVGEDGRPRDVHVFENATTNGIGHAIATYVKASAERPSGIVLAVAGPVAGRRARLTNRDWTIDVDELMRRFGFTRGALLNDFEALAWALPVLGAADVRPIGPACDAASGPRVVLGPGTGMGVAALVPTEDGAHAVATESGHMSYGPAAPDEWSVFERLDATHGPVSAEMVLSGPGLERLHAALHPARSLASAKEIVAAALAGGDTARATVRLFVRLLGRFAGDVALVFRATGGVFVAGGVAQRLADLIDAAAFRAAFEAHPPFGPFLARIPTSLIVASEPGLIGCAAYARSRAPHP